MLDFILFMCVACLVGDVKGLPVSEMNKQPIPSVPIGTGSQYKFKIQNLHTQIVFDVRYASSNFQF